jgi:hypothetical protein
MPLAEVQAQAHFKIEMLVGPFLLERNENGILLMEDVGSKFLILL